MTRLQNWFLRTLRTAVPPINRRLLQRDISAEFQRALQFQNAVFPDHLNVPSNFGKSLPERVPELLLAALSYQPGKKVLDVGYAHAMRCHLDMTKTLTPPRNLTGLDITPAAYDTAPYYKATLTYDLAGEDLPLEQFDLIWCISTLEHIGMDNSSYQKDFKRDEMADFRALENLFHLLSPSGQLLLTVPYGKEENNGWLRNYHRERWQGVLAPLRGAADITEWYFRHTHGGGWALCDADELIHVGYYDQNNSGAGGLAAALIRKIDNASI